MFPLQGSRLQSGNVEFGHTAAAEIEGVATCFINLNVHIVAHEKVA